MALKQTPSKAAYPELDQVEIPEIEGKIRAVETLVALLRQQECIVLASSPSSDPRPKVPFDTQVAVASLLQKIRDNLAAVERDVLGAIDLAQVPKWKNRRQLELRLDSLSWYDRFWEPLFRAGLVDQGQLRKADPELFNALHIRSRNHGGSIAELAPSRHPRQPGQTEEHHAIL